MKKLFYAFAVTAMLTSAVAMNVYAEDETVSSSAVVTEQAKEKPAKKHDHKKADGTDSKKTKPSEKKEKENAGQKPSKAKRVKGEKKDRPEKKAKTSETTETV